MGSTQTEFTYTEARANLAALWDEVINNCQTVILKRRGKENLAVLPASELEGLMETAHLLRSPRNAERLLTALARARKASAKPTSIKQLREEFGLGEEE